MKRSNKVKDDNVRCVFAFRISSEAPGRSKEDNSGRFTSNTFRTIGPVIVYYTIAGNRNHKNWGLKILKINKLL